MDTNVWRSVESNHILYLDVTVRWWRASTPGRAATIGGPPRGWRTTRRSVPLRRKVGSPVIDLSIIRMPFPKKTEMSGLEKLFSQFGSLLVKGDKHRTGRRQGGGQKFSLRAQIYLTLIFAPNPWKNPVLAPVQYTLYILECVVLSFYWLKRINL